MFVDRGLLRRLYPEAAGDIDRGSLVFADFRYRQLWRVYLVERHLLAGSVDGDSSESDLPSDSVLPDAG